MPQVCPGSSTEKYVTQCIGPPLPAIDFFFKCDEKHSEVRNTLWVVQASPFHCLRSSIYQKL